MNTGIQDAHNLAWKLARVAADHGSESLLKSYHAEREPVAQGVLNFTDRLTQAATLHHPLALHLRNVALSILAGIETIEHQMADRLAEIAIHYRHSPIVAQNWPGLIPAFRQAGPAAGDRAPDGCLQDASGRPVRLFELFRDTRHTLLLLSGSELAPHDYRELEHTGRTIQDEFGQSMAVHLVIAGEEIPRDFVWDGSLLFDAERGVHRRYGADSACLYLVRPDGYIGFRSMPAHRANLRTYFDHILP